MQPEKADSNRTRITAGSDQLDYDGDTATHSASTAIIKCHWSSILSDEDYKYCTGDVGNMNLESPLPEPQYARFKLDEIPKAVMRDKYNLNIIASNSYEYAQIDKS